MYSPTYSARKQGGLTITQEHGQIREYIGVKTFILYINLQKDTCS